MYIYRFHDFIAINPPGKSETIYLTADEAREAIAHAWAILKEIDQGISFSRGTVKPATIETSGSRYR